MEVGHTTVVVQKYLDELAAAPGDAPAEPIVRDLLPSAVNRLHGLCAALLYRSYPRLARPPLNLQTEETPSCATPRRSAGRGASGAELRILRYP